MWLVSRGSVRRCRFRDRVAIARLSRQLQPYSDPAVAMLARTEENDPSTSLTPLHRVSGLGQGNPCHEPKTRRRTVLGAWPED
jgi:hypothetical protein